MTTGSVILLVILIVLAVLAVALILAAKRRKRSEQLQGRFGPEYDRAVDEHGDRKAAESHLSDVADRRDALEIRDLSAEDRSSFSDRWLDVQTAFVDRPAGAVRDADHLVGEVMRKRGYPVDDFETKVDMIAVDHPKVVEHYRSAHAIAGRGQDQNTEDNRQAFVHYRALFAELLDDGEHGRHAELLDDGEQGRRAEPDGEHGRRTEPDVDHVEHGRRAEPDVDLTDRDRSAATRREE